MERADEPTQRTTVRQSEEPRKWLEPVIALIMALATVGTAWSSYESAAWTRQSGGRMNEFNSLERRASVLNVQGMQAATIHIGLFTQAIAAQQAGNEKLMKFYVDRFPPEMRKAYDAWIAQHPLDNPNADPHPFVPSLYELPGSREAAEASAAGAKKVEEARAAGNLSGAYLANTVLFAAVLFFANAAGKFGQRRVRTVSFVFAVAVFLFAVARIAMLPR